MITAGDFRNGMTFEEEGNVMQIIEFQHVKPGKGAAFVRTKVKNVITGSVVEKTYNPSAKFPTAYVERKDVEKYAHLATYDEIEKNGFNLNIPRYVDTSEEEEEIDLQATFAELAKLEKEEKKVDKKLSEYFSELGLTLSKEG